MGYKTEISVGDKCFTGSAYRDYRQDKIERETKTQWVLKSGQRYRKENLRKVGDHYGSQLHPYSKKIVDHVILNDKQSSLSSLLYDLSILRNRINITDIKELDEMILQAGNILKGLKKEV